MSRPNRKLMIAVGFDGVLHSHTSYEYEGDKILDPPVPGMLAWLTSLVRDPRFIVIIFSTRAYSDDNVVAMKTWLKENGVSDDTIDQLEWSPEKPHAHLIIDDRAIEFKGRPIPIDEIADFRPWNRA